MLAIIRVLISSDRESTFSLFSEDVVRPGEEISRNTNFSSLRMNLALLEREFVGNVIINVLCCVSSQLSVTKLEHGSLPSGCIAICPTNKKFIFKLQLTN